MILPELTNQQLASRGGQVIVEKFLPGDDHRISVSGGKVIGALCLHPASVTGDGRKTISQLIEEENAERLVKYKNHRWVVDIVVDNTLVELIRVEGLALESVPDAGQKVILRANANLSTGGISEDVMDRIHPDNLQMCLDVARIFRLDIIGLDFISRDISMSWREEGVIVEINAHPGLYEEPVVNMMREKFFEINKGRIPVTLVVTDTVQKTFEKVEHLARGDLNIGYIDEASICLNGSERNDGEKSFYKRAVRLLIDPACEQLIIAVPADKLKEQGLPVDYFDEIYIDLENTIDQELRKELSGDKALRKLLNAHAGKIKILDVREG